MPVIFSDVIVKSKFIKNTKLGQFENPHSFILMFPSMDSDISIVNPTGFSLLIDITSIQCIVIPRTVLSAFHELTHMNPMRYIDSNNMCVDNLECYYFYTIL